MRWPREGNGSSLNGGVTRGWRRLSLPSEQQVLSELEAIKGHVVIMIDNITPARGIMDMLRPEGPGAA